MQSGTRDISDVSQIVQEAASMHRQVEAALGSAGMRQLAEAAQMGTLGGLAGESFAHKILEANASLKAAFSNDFGVVFRPSFPEWLGSAKLAQVEAIAGIGSDLALARTRFESLDASILERFGASNAVLMRLDESKLSDLAAHAALPGEGVLATLQSGVADLASRDRGLWQDIAGYHIASQLAVARIGEAIATHEHWATVADLAHLNRFSEAYDRLVGDVASSTALAAQLLPRVPAELFGHAALLELFRSEADLEETAEGREAYVDETRREFRRLVEARHPELLEHVRAADQARTSRGPGWAATFCLALRRLIDHAFDIIAPVAAVRTYPVVVNVATSNDEELKARILQPSGDPTRFARILFATRGADPAVDIALPRFVGTDFQGVNRILRLLNRHIHQFAVPVDEAALDLAQARAERYTLFVLLLSSRES